jgi:hypothetical protein
MSSTDLRNILADAFQPSNVVCTIYNCSFICLQSPPQAFAIQFSRCQGWCLLDDFPIDFLSSLSHFLIEGSGSLLNTIISAMHLPVDNSLSSDDFTDLKRTLLQSNQFYRCIAVDLRSIPLKNSARRRARELGLRINIDKAKACPQKAVSLLPLPIIESSPSPTVSLSFQSPYTRQHYAHHKRNWTLPSFFSPLVREVPQGEQKRLSSIYPCSPNCLTPAERSASPMKSIALRLSAIPNGSETTTTCPHHEASFLEIAMTAGLWADSEGTVPSSASDSGDGYYMIYSPLPTHRIAQCPRRYRHL